MPPRPDLLAALLAGPRGRRLCWELLGLPWLGWSHAPNNRTTAAVRTVLAGLAAADDETEARLFEALTRCVDMARYWQPPDECDVAIAGPQLLDVLRPVAEAVLACPLIAWWSAPIAAEQVHVRFTDDEPTTGPAQLAGVAARLVAWRDEQERMNARFAQIPRDADWERHGGNWWSVPCHPAFAPETARLLDRFGPAGLSLVEDSMGWTAAECRRLAATRTPRVYEITGPGDWAELVARHPLDVTESRGPDWYLTTGRRGRWLIADWPSVADEYDAVHLSVLGYLTTAGLPVPVDGDAATLIAGWAPDATYWLTDLLESAGPAGTWVREDDRWSPHRC